jgi:AraC family transcriptional regulator
MSKDMLKVAAALLVVAAIVGCGGQQAPKTETPAEPAFAAEVKTTEPMTVAAIAKMGPYNEAGPAFEALMKWVAEAKVEPAGPMMGVYLDDPANVKPESLRYEVCIPVPAGTKADAKSGVTVKEMAPMTLATAMHVGNPANVAETYAKLNTWIGENNYEVAGPGVEVYLSPMGTAPESTQTQVGMVVAPKAPAEGEAKPAEEGGK